MIYNTFYKNHFIYFIYIKLKCKSSKIYSILHLKSPLSGLFSEATHLTRTSKNSKIKNTNTNARCMFYFFISYSAQLRNKKVLARSMAVGHSRVRSIAKRFPNYQQLFYGVCRIRNKKINHALAI